MIGHRLWGASLAVVACAMLAACATTDSGSSTDSNGAETRNDEALAPGLDYAANTDPFPSTYRGLPRENVAIVGATVLTGTDR